MNRIEGRIESENKKSKKALTIFLTSGYPNPEKFVDLVLQVEKAGADIIEIGIPFADSLADGPVIQSSYIESLKHNINIEKTFKYVEAIREKSDIPIVLMSSANLILNYGKRLFANNAFSCGVDGVIVPDVPLEEYDDFYEEEFFKLNTILLSTPNTELKRINDIDNRSSGFLYCVSVLGTTGVRKKYDDYVLQNLQKTYSTINNNKMQIGFGVSSAEDIKQFSPFCDGLIVGSAVIKLLSNSNGNVDSTLELIKRLKQACNF